MNRDGIMVERLFFYVKGGIFLYDPKNRKIQLERKVIDICNPAKKEHYSECNFFVNFLFPSHNLMFLSFY